MDKLNPAKMLAGAAALLIVSAALFVTAKAVQEFMKTDWSAIGKAGVALLGLVGAVAALGAIMMSGVGAVAIIAGAAAMLVIAGSLLLLGKAIQATATGMAQFIPLMPALGSALKEFPITRLAAFGAAGLIAAPGMMAMSVAGRVAGAAKGAVKSIGQATGITQPVVGASALPPAPTAATAATGINQPAVGTPGVATAGTMAVPTAPSVATIPVVTAAGTSPTTSPPPPSTAITVDMSKLEAKLDQIVDRLAGMGVYMDGAKVGKMLHNSNDKQSVGMMRQQALQSV
jgi:hypothetical protein